MPATNKDELLARSAQEFQKLWTLIATIDADVLTKDDDDTSIKDVIAHRAHWIGLFLAWQRNGLAGKEVFFPAKGYKWSELKRYNADLREKQRDVDWPGAKRRLRRAHGKLIRSIEGLTNKELYGAPMKGAKNHWTTGRWAEAAGPSHYRSASKYIRKRLRA